MRSGIAFMVLASSAISSPVARTVSRRLVSPPEIASACLRMVSTGRSAADKEVGEQRDGDDDGREHQADGGSATVSTEVVIGP